MDYTQISIIKRDGKTEPFSLDKIVRAITKAFRAGGITDEGQAIEQIASDVAAAITKAEISVEEIQDMVEERLMKRNPSIAKRYIIYREWRNVERDRRSSIKSVMDGIVTVEKNDINIHVPEGAIPKDGPSAGITMVTSIVSSYTGRKVKERIAMTGETTLRGRVMPVGGVKEKILAAKRAGITELILSEENRKDIAEIKPEYIAGLTFHYVKTNEEVLQLALE